MVVARRVQEARVESPETVRRAENIGDLNISLCSEKEEPATEEGSEMLDIGELLKSPSYVAAAARGKAAQESAALEVPATEEWTEEEERAEGVGPEPVYRPPPTPPPWSRHFSNHPLRVLCTFCFAGNRETRNSRCSDSFRAQREKFRSSGKT